MAVSTGQVTCPSNADTVIVAALSAADESSVAGAPKRQVIVKNPSAQGVYVGTSTETSATGYLLASGDAPLTLYLDPTESLYGRGASSSPVVHFIITGG